MSHNVLTNEKTVWGSYDWLTQLFQTGFMSDITITDAKEVKHKVHKLVLANNSDFFKTNFTGAWKDKDNLEWHFDDPDNVLPTVLRFFYSQKIEVSVESWCSIYSCAWQLQATKLLDLLRDYFVHTVTPENSLLFLLQSCLHEETRHQNDSGLDISVTCIDKIHLHFKTLANNSHQIKLFSRLPYDIIIPILSGRVERSDHEEEAEISAVATAFIRNNQVSEEQYSTLLHFIKVIPLEDAITLLHHSVLHQNPQSIKRCVHMIASNFGYAAQKKISLKDVEPEIFLQIIQCEDLRVFSEDDIFIGIADYVADREGKSGEETIRTLFREVQFSDLSMDALFIAHKNQFIQRYALDYLTEGLMTQLKEVKSYVKGDNEPVSTSKIRHKYAFPFDPSKKTHELNSFAFDPSHKSSSVIISNQNTTVCGRGTIFGSMPIVETAYWEIRIDSYVGIPWVAIGIATKEHSLDQRICDSPYSWGIYLDSSCGFSKHNGKIVNSSYCGICKPGKIFGVYLNKGSLSFYEDGKLLGVAFENLQNRELFPAVTVANVETVFTILTKSDLPVAEVSLVSAPASPNPPIRRQQRIFFKKDQS